MITQVTRENEAEYFRRLGQAPFFASVMHTVYASCEGRGVQCFLAGELAALQVCGQRALLCGEPEDEAELASFLSFLGVARLKTQGCCPQGFAPHALPLLRFDVRRAPPVPPVPDGLRLENEPSLLAVRCIKGLSDGAVPPDSFAVDAAARRNRGLADIRALSADGTLAATAGVYALQPWEAYIGAVETAPAFRRRGCAGRVLERVIADARAQGRRGCVLTCKDKLVHYYEKFGFVNEGVSQSTHGGAGWYDMRLTF